MKIKIEILIPNGLHDDYVEGMNDEKRLVKIDYKKWHSLFSTEIEKEEFLSGFYHDLVLNNFPLWDVPATFDGDFGRLIIKTPLGDLYTSNASGLWAVGTMNKLAEIIFPY